MAFDLAGSRTAGRLPGRQDAAGSFNHGGDFGHGYDFSHGCAIEYAGLSCHDISIRYPHQERPTGEYASPNLDAQADEHAYLDGYAHAFS